MIATVYRSTRELYRRRDDHLVLRWDEYGFRELRADMWDTWPEEDGVGLWTHLRKPPVAISIELPKLAKVDGDRVYPPGDQFGVNAESCWWLASRGERGFRLAGSVENADEGNGVMAKKRHDHPMLFGEPEPEGVGAYGQAAGGKRNGDPRTTEANITPPWLPSLGDAVVGQTLSPAILECGSLPPLLPADESGSKLPHSKGSVDTRQAETSDDMSVPAPEQLTSYLAIERAGIDPVADIDQAFAFIRDGRGVVAIQILTKTRETIVKTRGVAS